MSVWRLVKSLTYGNVVGFAPFWSERKMAELRRRISGGIGYKSASLEPHTHSPGATSAISLVPGAQNCPIVAWPSARTKSNFAPVHPKYLAKALSRSCLWSESKVYCSTRTS